VKPYRSALFVPSSDLRKAEKALSLNADCIILDLEDAVAISEKSNARSIALDILTRASNKAIYVRINGIYTPFVLNDLMVVMKGNPAGIILPKAESKEEILRVDWLLSQLENEYKLSLGRVGLIPLIETAKGVLNAYEIASACTRVRCLAFGSIDYTLDIGTSMSAEGQEIFYARAHLVVVSRAAKCGAPIDTVYPEIRNVDGMRAESILARQLGFQGKLVIHPSQIEIANEIFSPTEKEIEYARKVIKAFKEAESQGIAAVQIEGKFIDYPVAAWAQKVLDAENFIKNAKNQSGVM